MNVNQYQPMSTIRYYPKPTDNIKSICTRFRMKPAEYFHMNPRSSDRTGDNYVLVRASKDNACGKGCIVLSNKPWTQCDCNGFRRNDDVRIGTLKSYASYLLMVSPKTAQAMSRNLVNHNAGTSNSGSNAFAQNFAFDPLLSDSRITGGESNYRSITPEDQATSNALPEGGVANTMATVDVDGERAKFPEPKGINEAAERARFPTPNMDGHDFVTRTDTYFAELSRFPIPDMAAGAAATGRATPEDAAATDGIVANAASAGVAMAGVDRAAERSKYPTPAGLSDSYTGRATPVDRPTDNNLEGRVAVAAMMKPVADRASERAKFPAPTWANNNASYRNTTAYRSSTPEDQATSNALPEGGVANNMATVDVHAERAKFPAPTTSARNEW